jgi:Nucleoside 2-deoxyribosyltransferase
MGPYYVAHRLFAAHDRALGAYVAQRLARHVGANAVFLPFCHTDEEGLTDACKGRRLFELDCERLRRIDGMLALLHGPSLDDGVCMEIGYAAALGVPVVAMTTDFQTYGRTSDGHSFAFPDPLFDILLTEVVRVHRLAPPPAATTDRFEAFLYRNLQPVHAAADQAITALLRARPRMSAGPTTAVAGERRVFVELPAYPRRGLWRQAARLLRSRGWGVHLATRFHEPAEPRDAAQADWAASLAAGLTLIDATGPETPPGAALLTGACAATRRPVLAADPGGWWTFADGREPNWRNLMIQYAVSGRFASIGELGALVAGL